MSTIAIKSLLMEFIPYELYKDLNTVVDMHVDNSVKEVGIKYLLTKYNIQYTSLGSGTNRLGILIGGYAFKFAYDKAGCTDNKREFKYSKLLYPYAIKVYECFPNGLISVSEYIEVFTEEDFWTYREPMKNILTDLSSKYLIGDVGIIKKNLTNWGVRHSEYGDQICILDFAYIYDVSFGTFTCNCDNITMLEYDKSFSKFICPHCSKVYTFEDLRSRITKKLESEEIGDIRDLSYNVTSDMQTVEYVPEYSEMDIDRDEEEIKENVCKIKEYEKYEQELEEQNDLFDYHPMYEDDE